MSKNISRFTKLKKQVAATKSQQSVISKFFKASGSAASDDDVSEDRRGMRKSKKDASVDDTEDENEEVELMPMKKKPKLDNSAASSSYFSPTCSGNKSTVSSATLQKLMNFGLNNEPNKRESKSRSSDLVSGTITSSEDSHSLSMLEDQEEGNSSQDEKDEQASSKSKKSAKVQKSSKSESSKYTPFEQQYLEIKEKHSDCLLLVECGYKFRFFGKDAEIASKELNIGCFPCHNFLSASIPVHRLHIHVKRLVTKGYKVGLVRQVETAALKAAGNSKSSLFSRQLTALYTKSTLIGEELESIAGANTDGAVLSDDTQKTRYLICIYETSVVNAKDKATIGILAVQPTISSDIMYHSFEDDALRSELESCLTLIQPVELLIPQTLTQATMRTVTNFADFCSSEDDRPRIEVIPDDEFEFTKALLVVTDFYKDSAQPNSSDETLDGTGAKAALSLPPVVIRCLATSINYLKKFKLEKALQQSVCFSHVFSTSCNVKLNAATVRNLELFHNLTNWKEEGSLFRCIDHTSTRFGRRLLHQWLAKPLAKLMDIKERQDVITELKNLDSLLFGDLQKLLWKLPDLEKGLCSIMQQKCSTSQVYIILQALNIIQKRVQELLPRITAASGEKSMKLQRLLSGFSILTQDVQEPLGNLREEAAMSKDKCNLFIDESPYPALVKRKQEIRDVENQLQDIRPKIARSLGLLAFNYVTVSGQEYLIEVKNSSVSSISKDWLKISATKQVSRFRSPEVQKLFNHLKQSREQLQLDAQEAWLMFLRELGNYCYKYKKAVSYLAELDCYLSLTAFAMKEGYCKPSMVEGEQKIVIEKGRNPVLECLLASKTQCVSNDTFLDNQKRCQIITGPNMGGKSSYVRQVALIVLLAHIGSYVPAESATISIVDGIYMRMGATDDLQHGKSTFMVELQETSEILHKATSRSLVMLDELGRGTSTHDGMAIAYATLEYFIERIRCLILFVTHYPPVTELEKVHPGIISNQHMAFFVHTPGDAGESSCTDPDDLPEKSITFLYQVEEGIAEKSYGLNVAHLAGLPSDIISKAHRKSHELEMRVNKARLQKQQFCNVWTASADTIKDTLKSLRSCR